MLRHDVRDTVRGWRRAPIVTAVAILSLVLGVGANTALFSVLNALLFKPLPMDAPEELVRLRDERRPNTRLSSATWNALRERQTVLAELAAYAPQPVELSIQGEPTRSAAALFVSGAYFKVLRIEPAVGRVLADQDDLNGVPPVALVSHPFWSTRLGADPSVVGRTLQIERRLVTIIGVSEPGFFGLEVGRTFDVVLSLSSHAQLFPKSNFASLPMASWLQVVGRLGDGTAVEGQQTALRVLQKSVGSVSTPWDLEPVANSMTGIREDYRTAVAVLLLVTTAVLLIACINIANLLLARNSARQRDLGIRLSLGASKWQLLRLVFTESAAMAVIATVVGFAVGIAGSRFLVGLISTFREPVYLDLTPDKRVIGASVAIVIVMTLVCAASAGWRALRLTPIESLSAINSTRRAALLPYAMLSLQIAITFAITVLSMAFVGSLLNITQQHYGFERNRVVVASVNYSQSDIPRERRAAFASQIKSELERLNGVENIALSMSVPFGAVTYTTNINNTDTYVFFAYVSNTYFAVTGLPLRIGEPFSQLSGPDAVLVSETLARNVFGRIDVIGETIRLKGVGAESFRIVGVTADIKQTSLRADSPAFVFLPWLATTSPPGTLLHVFLRTSPNQIIGPGAISAAVERAAPGATILVRSLDDEAEATIVRDRVIALLATVLGAMALLLAAIGLYGVIAYQVIRRQREIGIRIALGSTRLGIVRTVLSEAGFVCAVGLGAGTMVAVMATSALRALLFSVSPASVGLLLQAAALSIVVVTIAALVPARRAALVDPVETFRQE